MSCTTRKFHKNRVQVFSNAWHVGDDVEGIEVVGFNLYGRVVAIETLS